MKCQICKNGETTEGLTSVTFTKDKLVVVIKNVPALICDNCGEQYIYENVTASLLQTANEVICLWQTGYSAI